MPTKKRAAAAAPQTDPAVAEFLSDLDHPLKPEIEALRRIILGVSPEISEGIKWNAPSFRTTEHFATFNIHRVKDRVRLILHRGAKPKTDAKAIKIDDPEGLLEWLAKDRCLLTFTDMKDIRAKKPALEAIIRQWMRHV